MRLPLLLGISLLALGATSTVQAQGVPYGQYVFSFCDRDAAWPEGLGLNDKSTCKPVTGLAATGLSTNVNCVQIDPCNDSIWLGFCDNDALGNISIDANCTVSSGTNWGRAATSTAATGQPINKICFDFNCQPLAASGGHVWRFDRNSPGNGSTIASFSGVANAICCDSNNLYVGVSNQGIYRLPRVLGSCTYGSPILVCAVPENITGCAVCPTTGDVWYTITALGSGSVATCSSGGSVATSTKPGNIGPQNGITHDVRSGDFQIVNAGAGTAADVINQIDKQFCVTPVCTLAQSPGSLLELTGTDTDDCDIAMTGISPDCGVIGTGRFVMELWTCCKPGDFYGIFLLSPSVNTISVGVAPPSGKVCLRFANLRLPAGFPVGGLLFTSACSDPGFTQLTIGAPKFWPGS